MPPLKDLVLSGVVCFASIAILSLVVACAANTPNHTGDSNTLSKPDDAVEGATVPSADTLTFQLEVPDTVALRAPVPITLRVTNNGSAAVDLYLRGRSIAFDIVITNAAGDTVWHRLQDAVIDASLQIKVLRPRDALVLTDTWNQRTNAGESVPAGDYSVRASLLTDQAEPTTFSPAVLRIAGK
jgi:hypothetical protein